MNSEVHQKVWTGTALGNRIGLDKAGKDFGKRQVIRGIDLSIGAGEFVAIVGRSGCGKTTLLRLIAGLEPLGSGQINIDDAPVAGLNPHVKLLFQDARLLPWASVLQNVGVARGPDWQKHASEVLRRVGLEGRERDWPSVLSGGQKQRVALARALVSKPSVLLLDEPFGALDALTRLEMHDLLAETWRRDGFTTVLITHDVAEAVALADRVVVLQEGRVTLDLPITLPRPRRAVGDATTAKLQAEILRHVA